MPVGRRVRANNVFGMVNNNPLTAGATTLNSVELSLLPEVSSNHAVITLDPLRANGEPEIVIVTAHTAGAQSATVSRGAYGTVARSHPQGSTWIHGPLAEDVISVVTSSTRPSDPYDGQLIFETDTNVYTSRIGGAWAGLIPAGVMTPFAGTSAPTGWLMCDGTAVSRTTFADLFSVLGVAYGVGDGSTTFNIPDLRNKVPVGVGTDFPTRGAVGGSKDAVAVSHNHIQDSHNHSQNGHGHSHGHSVTVNGNNFNVSGSGGHTHNVGGSSGNVVGFRTDAAANGLVSGGLERLTYTTVDSVGNHDHNANHAHSASSGADATSATATNIAATATNQSAGVSATGGNMQPFQTVNYIIKH